MTSGLLALILLPVIASAQTRGSAVRGTISGAGGLPLPRAIVTREGSPDTVRADSIGRYVIAGLPAGLHRLTFRHVGYAPSQLEVEFGGDTTITVDVPLEGRVMVLDTMRVRESPLGIYERRLNEVGFEERRQHALRTAVDASFLTPDDIERRRARRMSHLLDGKRSVKIEYLPNGIGAIARGRDGRCVMSVWLDGQLVIRGGGQSNAMARGSRPSSGGDDQGIEIIDPDMVAGIEIYPSPTSTPPQFQSLSGGCGAIVIWTKQ